MIIFHLLIVEDCAVTYSCLHAHYLCQRIFFLSNRSFNGNFVINISHHITFYCNKGLL